MIMAVIYHFVTVPYKIYENVCCLYPSVRTLARQGSTLERFVEIQGYCEPEFIQML